ncbi:uncharacterized protein LOC134276943 [Saccostrea cucullata]|uniref:uncharacterized protein LOC134276943 n=1 Tax=Saccostrea cuccullata TaxID=36930 RepID=UPI002ED12CD6
MFNSTETLNGRGFNLSVKAVDSPPPFLDQFFVESKHDFIKITWRPYDGEKDLLRYLVTYNVIPDVGHHVVPVRVGRPSTTYVIDTNTHQGQLFAVRLSYLSEGGEGIPSNVKIIRASCGRAVRLRHNQTFTIRSPEVNGSYLSNVICRWNLQADHGLWYKVNKLDIVKLDIENSTLCQKDYVEIPGKRRFCGNKPDSVIIKDHRAAITFVTDDSNYATGFTAMATAVYPPSGRPRNLTLTPARYGFFSEWEKPFLNPSYVRGYRINYRRLEKTEVSEMVVPSNDNSAFINTLSFPGNLFEVWMSAIGEAQDSALTEKRQILSDCGEFLKIDKSVHLISTPFYPEFPNVTCQCSWTLSSLHNLSFSFLEIHRYDNHTTNSTEDEFLILNNTKHSFANISEGMQFLLHKNEVEKIEIRTKKTSFLAAIKPVHDEETSVRSFKRSSSSVQRLDPS